MSRTMMIAFGGAGVAFAVSLLAPAASAADATADRTHQEPGLMAKCANGKHLPHQACSGGSATGDVQVTTSRTASHAAGLQGRGANPSAGPAKADLVAGSFGYKWASGINARPAGPAAKGARPASPAPASKASSGAKVTNRGGTPPPAQRRTGYPNLPTSVDPSGK